MKGLGTVYRRELAGLFLGPLAWVLLCLALFLNGLYFTLYVDGTRGDVAASLELALGGSKLFWGFSILFAPLLTMRMISEEARTGMLEFLLTAPVSDAAVVLGKLLAATTLLALLWGTVAVYALTLAALGAPPDWGPVWTGLAGAVLVSALFSSIGLVASAGTGTPLVAAFLALVINIALLSLPYMSGLVGGAAGEWLSAAALRLDVIRHYQSSFLLGVLDTHDLAFFLVWTAFFAVLATRLLEARRWR